MTEAKTNRNTDLVKYLTTADESGCVPSYRGAAAKFGIAHTTARAILLREWANSGNPEIEQSVRMGHPVMAFDEWATKYEPLIVMFQNGATVPEVRKALGWTQGTCRDVYLRCVEFGLVEPAPAKKEWIRPAMEERPDLGGWLL